MKKYFILLASILLTGYGAIYGQYKIVAGTVVNNKNKACSGVTVVVKGTAIDTVTDTKGNFALTLPEGSYTLVFSSTGYATKELEAEDNMRVLMVPMKDNKKSKGTKVEYEDAETIQELTSYKCSNGKYGYKDKKTGAAVIPCKYENASSFFEGLAAVKLKEKYGFIDKTGKLVVPCKYEYAWFFSKGLATVQLKGKYGFVDKTGAEVIPCKYEHASSFFEELAEVKLNGKYGFIDKTGKEVIPFKYERVKHFSEELAAVKLKGKYGFIDKTGMEVIPFKYEDAKPFSEGLAEVKLSGKCGFIDKTGAEVIPFKYEDVKQFSEGLAPIKLNGKWGYIDKTDKVIIPFYYNFVSDFSNYTATVELNNKWGVIDIIDTVIIPIKYESKDALFKSEDYNNRTKITDSKKANGEYDAVLALINPANYQNLFSGFAKIYIESKINLWQQKGESESTADWQQRVNETTGNDKIKQLLKDAEKEYIAAYSKLSKHNLELGTYDENNQVYLIKSNLYGNLPVPVPVFETQYFEIDWEYTVKTPKYFIENDKLALAEMSFAASTDTYKYKNPASLNYTVPNIDYNFVPIDINIDDNSNPQKEQQNTSTENVPVTEDEDINIPENGN